MIKGFIYILKNPSFPDYIKIGYATDVKARLGQLNRSECIPFAFRVRRHSGLSPTQSQKFCPAKPGRTKSSRGPTNGT